jgi:26S proteasome regulatory subunit N7
MSDPQYSKYPHLHLAQHIFSISNPACPQAKQHSSLEALQAGIKEHKMAPLYRHLAHPTEGILNPAGEGGSSAAASPPALRRQGSTLSGLLAAKAPSHNIDLPWDEKLYEELKADNEKELETIQKQEDEAVEKEGETEIQAARAKRAEFWARVGDKVR